MTTLRDRILSAVVDALAGAAITGVSVVTRAREIASARSEGNAVVVRPKSDDVTRKSTQVDEHRFMFEVQVYSRGDPWDVVAEPICAIAHAVLFANAPLMALVSDLRGLSISFESQDGDETIGVLTADFSCIYLSNFADPAAQI